VRASLAAHGGHESFGIPSDLTRIEEVQPR
jgi:NitT/TauT family transport system substrate-binding protein